MDIAATGSDAGDSVVLRVVNRSSQVQPLVIQLESFRPQASSAKVTSMAGPLDASNSADNPHRVRPEHRAVKHRLPEKAARIEVAPCSYTVLEFN